MISDFASVLTPSIKDDRNVVSKRELQKFIEDTYFNGKVENVMLGTTVTRYDNFSSTEKYSLFFEARETV